MGTKNRVELVVQPAFGEGRFIFFRECITFQTPYIKKRETVIGLNQIRLYIMCESPVLRRSLTAIFSSDNNFILVGEAGCCPDSVSGVQKVQPDAIICEVKPGLEGIDLVCQLKESCPYTLAFGFINTDDIHEVRAILNTGLDGFLFKSMLPSVLVKTVDLTCRSGILCLPASLKKLLNGQPKAENANDISSGHKEELNVNRGNGNGEFKNHLPLTPREMEIYSYLTQNYSNKDLCEKLYISQATVKSHVSSILRKLGLSSRTELFFYEMSNRPLYGGLNTKKDKYI